VGERFARAAEVLAGIALCGLGLTIRVARLAA